jgi:hypothetical protein
MTYFDERRASIVLRDSPRLTGPWTGQKILVKGSDYSALYGGYIYPRFNDSDKVYFNMSQWQPYNVFFMRAQLTVDKEGENILSDPSFEDQSGNGVSAPWVRGSNGATGIDRNLGYARSGSNNASLRATRGFPNIYQEIAVMPNRNYRLTGWVKTSRAFRVGYFGVRTADDGVPIAEVRYGSSVGTPSGVYRQLTVDFNSGARTSVRVFVGMAGPGSGAFAQIDDLAVTLSSGAPDHGYSRAD